MDNISNKLMCPKSSHMMGLFKMVWEMYTSRMLSRHKSLVEGLLFLEGLLEDFSA